MDFQITKGMQIAIQTVAKMMGFDPKLAEVCLVEITKSLQGVAADMATIRRQNTAIMAHLGIADHADTERYARRQLNGSGADETGGDAC